MLWVFSLARWVMVHGTNTLAIFIRVHFVWLLSRRPKVVHDRCWITALHAVNESLTHDVYSQNGLTKPMPRGAVIFAPDWILVLVAIICGTIASHMIILLVSRAVRAPDSCIATGFPTILEWIQRHWLHQADFETVRVRYLRVWLLILAHLHSHREDGCRRSINTLATLRFL